MSISHYDKFEDSWISECDYFITAKLFLEVYFNGNISLTYSIILQSIGTNDN